jgi:hypothetical protein
VQVAVGGDDEPRLAAEHAAQVLHHEVVRRVGDGYDRHALLEGDRERVLHPRLLLGNERDRRRIG